MVVVVALVVVLGRAVLLQHLRRRFGGGSVTTSPATATVPTTITTTTTIGYDEMAKAKAKKTAVVAIILADGGDTCRRTDSELVTGTGTGPSILGPFAAQSLSSVSDP